MRTLDVTQRGQNALSKPHSHRSNARNHKLGSRIGVSKRSNKLNPYMSDMYRENELLSASNAYHRLDSQQNVFSNKAYALTVINDLKTRKR